MEITMVIAGIDYSMTSPAIVIHKGTTWSFENCKFYFRTDKKSLEMKTARFESQLIDKWTCAEERFAAGAAWAHAILSAERPERLTLEGYAMGAKGLVFHIGENTGQLKQQLWKLSIPFDVPAPSAIKKFATGKGNAKKDAMEAAFVAETNFDMRKAMGQTQSSFSPSGDLIDAYYMAKWCFHQKSLTDQ
jgi:Holliday junction resolvasome RuvABC endonuclease subunit